MLGECGRDRWATLPLAGPFTCGSSTPHLLSSREKWHTHPQEHLHGDVYGTFIKITQTVTAWMLNAGAHTAWPLSGSSSGWRNHRLLRFGCEWQGCVRVSEPSRCSFYTTFSHFDAKWKSCLSLYINSPSIKKQKQNELQCRATIWMDLNNISLKRSRIFYTAWYPSYKVKYN